MSHRSEVRKAELRVIDAARSVAVGGDTDDGMVEVKWDEMIVLRDAIDALDALGLVEPGAARHSRGAPLTSQTAARWMSKGPARHLTSQIVDFLYNFRPNVGATVPELIETLQRPHQSVSARVNELRDTGWLVDSGRTRMAPSGHEAVVWILSETAYRLIQEATRDHVLTGMLSRG